MPRNHRVSKRRRAAAIATLHEIATDPKAPAHARATAARTIILDSDGDDTESVGKPDKPPALLVLPSNGRDLNVLPLGIHRSDVVFRVFYDATTPEGIAQGDAWVAEAKAEIAAAFPDELLALPAPDA